MPKNSFVLNQLPYINKLKSNFSSLITYFITPVQYPPAINFLPAELNSNILNSEFDNNILDTLIFNLVPNFNKLELLSHEV